MRFLLHLLLCSISISAFVACGGSAVSPSSGDGGSPEAMAVDASDSQTSTAESGSVPLAQPVCSSVPALPTGTVAVQGAPGLNATGGGAWSGHDLVPSADGGAPSTRTFVAIVLSDEANACAFGTYVFTGIAKANEHALVIQIETPGSDLPAAGTYANDVYVDAGLGIQPVEVALGSVSPDCGGFSSDGVVGGTITLSEVTPDHVKGSFSLPSSLSGTFDVPMCPALSVPSQCCVP
jgi:hypothetical protein